jgi:hypothetical protein
MSLTTRSRIVRATVAAGIVNAFVSIGGAAQATGYLPPPDTRPVYVGYTTPAAPGLHEVQPDGTGDRVVPGTDALSSQAAWSPDGDRVAFIEAAPSSSGPDVTNQSLVVSNIDGVCHAAVPNPDQSVYADPVWSPDGLRLAVVHFDGASSRTGPVNERLEVMDADGGHRKVVGPVNGGGTAWAPDNSGRLVFANDAGLQTYDLASGRTVVLDAASDAEFPVWSPDSARIAYSVSTAPALWVVNSDGSGRHSLTTVNPADHEDFFPAWSPTGNQIAWSRSSTNAGSDVWVIGADGSGARALTNNMRAGPVRWSPNGDLVAFDNADAPGSQSVWVVAAFDGATRQLVAGAHVEDFFRRKAAVPFGGYRIAAAGGGVAGYGTRCGLGSVAHPAQPIVGMASTAGGGGYWLVASDGGIFTFGDATFKGSTGAIHLNRPIVGMAATPDGGGYWLVASDGGIFTFGDATFKGSTGAIHLNRPIVGMAATPDGGGYWLVASDGGIFAFGDATFKGSTGDVHLNQPIVAIATAPDGSGYWLVASDGGIFGFGSVGFFGSTGAIHLNQPIVGMTPTPDAGGYWLVAADGGIFTFGNARFAGAGAPPGPGPVVAMAA